MGIVYQENILKYFSESSPNSYSPTEKGLKCRELRWQELGFRHHSLINQENEKLKHLGIALIASGHGVSIYDSQGITCFYTDTLPIYLWKYSEKEINDLLNDLLESDLIVSANIPKLHDKARVRLTADGEIFYEREVIPRLGLSLEYTILQPLDKEPPVFSNELAENLRYRWEEAERCFNSGSWLAATIMYGSILETVLYGKLSQNLEQTISSSKAKRNKKKEIEKDLSKWHLYNFIEVAEDLNYIDKSMSAYSNVLRDARNLIHPTKQIKEVNIPNRDSTKTARQIVESITNIISN